MRIGRRTKRLKLRMKSLMYFYSKMFMTALLANIAYMSIHFEGGQSEDAWLIILEGQRQIKNIFNPIFRTSLLIT